MDDPLYEQLANIVDTTTGEQLREFSGLKHLPAAGECLSLLNRMGGRDRYVVTGIVHAEEVHSAQWSTTIQVRKLA